MAAPPDQPDFWNRATGKSFAHPLDDARFTNAVAPGARILDYGCGPGRLCARLHDLGYTNLSGVDFSPEMIRVARTSNPHANFTLNDGLQLTFADASFDAVLLFAVLTCIPDTGAQRALLAELRRALCPGGLLLVSDYPLQTDARNLARYTEFAHHPCGYGTFRVEGGAWLRHHRREWFDELLGGFQVEHCSELDVLTMNGNPARIVQIWARKKA